MRIVLFHKHIPPLESHLTGVVRLREHCHVYHIILMQIYLRILFYLTIYLHHLPIMNDVHRQQEVGLSIKHSPASEPPEGYPDINNAELKAMGV